MMKRVDYGNPYKLHIRYAVKIKDCNSCLKAISDSHTRGFLCPICNYDKCDQWDNTYPGTIGKNLKRDFSFFKETGIHGFVVLNYFGRMNQDYASTVEITREFGFYVIAPKTMATMIISQLTFLWLLQKVIFHLKILYVIIVSYTEKSFGIVYVLNCSQG